MKQIRRLNFDNITDYIASNQDIEKSFFESKQAHEIRKNKSESNSPAKKHIVEFVDFFFSLNQPDHYFLVLEICDVILFLNSE
jgi:hypothetical protein